MPKKTAKSTKPAPYPLFVYGLDEHKKPRGARFPHMTNDIAKAAMDLKCEIVTNAPKELIDLSQKLPQGRIYASGKAFIPNIRRDLYDRIKELHWQNNRCRKTKTDRK